MNDAKKSRSRSAARLGAVQALYQQEMEKTPLALVRTVPQEPRSNKRLAAANSASSCG